MSKKDINLNYLTLFLFQDKDKHEYKSNFSLQNLNSIFCLLQVTLFACQESGQVKFVNYVCLTLKPHFYINIL